MVTVCAWLWSDENYRFNDLFRYGVAHANRTYRAFRDRLSIPHEFVLLTDRTEGLDPGIRAVPVPTQYAEMGACYRRLWLFSKEAREVLGERVIQTDLDCVVTGDLTPLFDRNDDFVIWRHGATGPENRTQYCASLLMLRTGSFPEVWECFDPRAARLATRNLVGSDQAWIWRVLGPDMPTWGRDDGVYSFRAHFHGGKMPGRAKRLGKLTDPPDDCRIVYFHGPFDPSQPELQAQFPWIANYWSEGVEI